jgi:hypothetical protein
MISDCTFSENTAINGGGIYDQLSSTAYVNCSFFGNLATRGGGVNSNGGTLINCIFSGNSASAEGGGLYNNSGNTSIPTVTNSTFSGNSAPQGGGIYNAFSSPLTVTNCILWGNSSELGNGSGNPVVTYSIVQQSSGVYPGTGNLNVDPIFVSQPPIGLGSSGDLRLLECSPAIDAGNDSANSTSEDLDGNDRTFEAIPGTPTIDMGAYEFQGTTPDPTPICPTNLTVQLDVNLTVTVTAAQIGDSSDGCGELSFLIDGESSLTFDCDGVGPQTVTLQVTDLFMNVETTSCSFTVADDVNTCCDEPVANCQDFTAVLVGNSVTVTPANVDAGSTADCGLAALGVMPNTFGCADVGTPQSVTLTITDTNNDTDACQATVTVEDNIAPTALCQNVTVQLDANGSGSTSATAVDNGSSDACGLSGVTLSQTSFGCADTGGNTVTLTVTDVNNNANTCTATVTVEDNIAPTAACLNTTVEIQPDGFYDLQQSDVYDATNSSDNCSIASVSFPATTFGCDDLDLTFPVMVTVTDPSGNTDDCTANVSVVAGTALPPEWSANDIGNQGGGSDYAYDPCVGNNPDQADFTISTGGYNLIPQNNDNVAFSSVPLCGNGGIQARIESVSGGYAGLMIRESSAPGAKMFAVYSNLTNLLRREIRTVENGQRSSNTFFASFPQWLRLVRQGDLIRAFYRNSNGGNWTLFHQAYLPMGNCVEMGLAVFTTDPSGDASAVFSKVNYQSQGGQSLSTPNTLAWEAETPDVQSASVLPNPVRGNFTLQFSKPLAAAGQAVLLNQAGQALRQRQLQPGVLTTDWNASDLPAGLYFMEIATEDGYREVLKVVRQ